ncbi:hypothetical protein DCC81_04260 [Chitinophaga parva]|uniref:Uncharacterized protein n=2 Tax=Chitinophaga parva TaxID=2169414 RepID=A0A2T7BLZ7_9BACT|nr:hypothetical protein DCC81_04260 [Chitinophaga parva]
MTLGYGILNSYGQCTTQVEYLDQLNKPGVVPHPGHARIHESKYFQFYDYLIYVNLYMQSVAITEYALLMVSRLRVAEASGHSQAGLAAGPEKREKIFC